MPELDYWREPLIFQTENESTIMLSQMFMRSDSNIGFDTYFNLPVSTAEAYINVEEKRLYMISKQGAKVAILIRETDEESLNVVRKFKDCIGKELVEFSKRMKDQSETVQVHTGSFGIYVDTATISEFRCYSPRFFDGLFHFLKKDLGQDFSNHLDEAQAQLAEIIKDKFNLDGIWKSDYASFLKRVE